MVLHTLSPHSMFPHTLFLHDMLNRAVRLWGDAPAVTDGELRLSYRELDARVRRLAAALQGLGLGHGAHIAVLALNGHRYTETYLAAALAGLVVAPVNTRLSAPETAFMLNDCEAKALLVGAACLPTWREARAALETVRHTILLDGDPAQAGADGVLAYEALLERADPDAVRPRDWREEDRVHLFYTGGTTGRSKGVMLSQRNVVSNLMHAIQFAELNERDVWLHCAPMFHLADAWSSFALTLLGARHVYMEAFEPTRWLEAVQTHRVTATAMVPTMINAVINAPGGERYDVSSMRRIIYGASPMAPDRVRAAIARFGNCLQQGYGQSESSPFLTVMPLRTTNPDGDEKDVRRLASCGQELIGTQVRVVDAEGRDVQPGEVGEIVARGPNVMLGYWKRPEETAKALRDGWLYTGDLATVDEEHYVYIVDRAKDMIISGGENVYSTEVEAALYAHPAVLEAAVFGVPDDRWGEAVKASVVLRGGQRATAEALIAHCRTLIAHYKCPKSVDFLEALPKSGAGKILKSELRKSYWEGQARRVH
jgi:long-chain acyl-CoA synthetase